MKFIKNEDISSLTEGKLEKLYKKYYNPAVYRTFKHMGLDVNFVRAEGVHLYDAEGRRYLDCMAGYGATGIGHNNKRVLTAMEKFFNAPNIQVGELSAPAAVLANNIAYLTKDRLSYSYFVNSGSEAVEEAIKLALLHKKDGNIICFSNAYHGKNLGSISAWGNEDKKNYEPLLYNFIEVPFGDVEALTMAVNEGNIAAILAEPIQGEGGINLPPKNFFKDVRRLCDKHNILLIFDEIQTGLGRCGEMFCYESLGVCPDVMCISKALSGGIMPIGAMVVEADLWHKTYGKVKNSALLGSTFGANTLACVVANEALSVIKDEKLYKKSKELGAYALAVLKEVKHCNHIIKEVRGKGLMIGIEFDDMNGRISKKAMEFMVGNIISRLLNEHGIVSIFAVNKPNVLKFQPPLIASRADVDYFAESLECVLKTEKNILGMAISSIKQYKF